MQQLNQVLLWCGVALSAGAQPPNIIYILADDFGYGDLSCLGQILNSITGARTHSDIFTFGKDQFKGE